MSQPELKVINIIEEQLSVHFTGKINILASFNRQYLGHILFKNGELIQVKFQLHEGLKALYQLLIQEYSLQSFEYVLEPELVEDKERKIHFPYSVIKNKMEGIIKLYRDSQRYRPPENIKIIINPDFLKQESPVTPQEFDVLETLTEWNKPYDVYQHCKLLDHEITMALVYLRKKQALRTFGIINNADDSV